MSRSSTDGKSSSKDYFDSWQDLYAMMRQGKSFSGNERNCFFLSLDGKEFADVSAMSGLDFPDDGRGVAIVDWDLDGRQDVWISNRNGPRVRLMRNLYPGNNDFLALRLEGTSSNRDAIGARISVTTRGSAPELLVATLRAGESFLSQSSKWMHFGLGSDASITSLIVRWPGGAEETFTGVEPNSRYTLVEGSGQAVLWTAPTDRVALVPSKQVAPELSDSTRIVLAARFPLPEIPYLDTDLSPRKLEDRLGRGPMLVNLWASWCANCRVELNDIHSREGELQDAGLDILTLSVDEPDMRGAASRFLDEMQWPFQQGFADTATASIFDFLPQLIVEQKSGLALPTSFLLDARGRLAMIYRGPLDVDQLLTDVQSLADFSEDQRALATPFKGKWVGEPSGPRYFAIVRRLRVLGELDRAAEYLSKVRVGADFDPQKDLALTSRLLHARFDLARDLVEAGKHELAVPLFRSALELSPDNYDLYHALAGSLRKVGRLEEATAAYLTAIEGNPGNAIFHLDLGIAYLGQRDLDRAFSAFQEAVRLNPQLAMAQQNLGILYARRGEFDDAHEHMRLAVELNPESLEAHRNLALLLQQNGRSEEAIPVYLTALELRPGNGDLLYNLALAYLDTGRLSEAEGLLGQLREMNSPLADRLAKSIGAQ